MTFTISSPDLAAYWPVALVAGLAAAALTARALYTKYPNAGEEALNRILTLKFTCVNAVGSTAAWCVYSEHVRAWRDAAGVPPGTMPQDPLAAATLMVLITLSLLGGVAAFVTFALWVDGQ